MSNLKEYVIDEMIEHLEDMKGIVVCGCDLDYKIFEQEIHNGSYTCSTYKAIEWVKEYFKELVEVVEEINDNCDKEFLPNVFEETERFQLTCMFEISSYLIGECEIVQENWDDEIELTEENIKIICKQLEELKSSYEIF